MAYRWGIYVRISDDREGAGLGVARQEKEVREMIKARDPQGTVVGIYADNDISAYSGKPRPSYRRLLADIASGTVTAVGTWHTDRLHRAPRELEDYIDTCEPRKVPTHTVRAGEIDLSTPDGQMTARILGAVARRESQHKSGRLKSMHVQRAAAGKPTGGGYRPYGYRRIYDHPDPPHRIIGQEIVPEEAEVVRECARRFLAGEGLRTIATDLNKRGLRTSADCGWSTSSLSRMLASARIAGMREHRPRERGETKRIRMGDITATEAWPPIISAADSKALRDILEDTDRRISPGATGKHLCAGGILICGRCARPEDDHFIRMAGKSRGAARPTIYFCDGDPGRPGCGHCYIDGPGTDYVVTGWVAARISKPAFQKALQRRQSGAPDEKLLTDDIRAGERELNEWARDKALGRVTRQEWLTGTETARQRIARARAQLSTSSTTVVLDGLPAAQADLQAFLLDGDVPVARRRAVILTLLKRVIVAPATVPGRARFDPGRLKPEWKV